MALNTAQLMYLAYLVDRNNARARRQADYEEMVERLEGNIIRWCDQVDRLNDAAHRKRCNIQRNIERLERAHLRLRKLKSPETLRWLDELNMILNLKDEHFVSLHKETWAKRHGYYMEVFNTEAEITKLHQWIADEQAGIASINDKIFRLHEKIQSAEQRIR